MATDAPHMSADKVQKELEEKRREAERRFVNSLAPAKQEEEGGNNALLGLLGGDDAPKADGDSGGGGAGWSARRNKYGHYDGAEALKERAAEAKRNQGATNAKPGEPESAKVKAGEAGPKIKSSSSDAPAPSEGAPKLEGESHRPSASPQEAGARPLGKLKVGAHVAGIAKIGVGIAAGTLALTGLETYATQRALTAVTKQGSRGEALKTAGSAVAATAGSVAAQAARALVPFSASHDLWVQGGMRNKLAAVGWGVVDAAGLASLVIPVGGEVVEGAIMSAKVARAAAVGIRAVGIAQKVNLGAQVAEGTYTAAKFVNGHRGLVAATATVLVADTLHGGASKEQLAQLKTAALDDARKFATGARGMVVSGPDKAQTTNLARNINNDPSARPIVLGKGRGFMRTDTMTPALPSAAAKPSAALKMPAASTIAAMAKKTASPVMGMGLGKGPSFGGFGAS